MAKKVEIEEKEIEAPYELPEGWKWVRLGDCAKTISKGTTPKGGKDAYIEKGINYLRIENLMDDGSIDLSNIAHITKEQHEGFLKRSILEAGDLLISIAGTLGRVGFVKESDLPMNTNQAIAFARLHKDLFDNMYLKFAIESPFVNNELLAKTKVTSIPNLTLEIISNCLIPLPPTLAEQQRIVNRIESLFAKLDEAKEKAQNVVDRFETRKAAILHQAFTGNLTAKWHKENGVSDDSWEEITLEQITSKIGDGLHGTPVYSDDGKYAFINGNNFFHDHIEIKSDTKFVDEDEFKKYSSELNNETVFVSINGTLGRTAFYNNEKVILGKSACYINVISSRLDKYFLRWLFESKYFIDYANEKATGSTIKNLGLKAIRNLPISLPVLSEQQEIVRILDTVLEKERTAKSAAEEVLEQIDLLKKSILARAFRGEL